MNDPRTRYEALAAELESCAARVAVLRRHRGQVLEEWAAEAGSRQAVADQLGISRQRVGQIIDAGRAERG
jgi:hypothetical protein